MDAASYEAAKAVASAAASRSSRSAASPASATQPLLVFVAEGVNQTVAGGWFPPDANGTVGHTHFVQCVNNHIDMYLRLAGLVKSVSLNAFVGYATQPLFDPAIVYDPKWRRWIFTCPAFDEGAGLPQYLFIVVSQSSNPALAW
ncbi:MAG: hypothetical protein EXS36_19420 [Pedosphaera sp.]|nr:hypothetical protein [Pedosphaera sp.]